MIREWIDVSNYSKPFTVDQLDFLAHTNRGVCIGLQNAAKAKAFKAQCISAGIDHDYYTERPGRDLSIPEPGAMVWEDIEPGCLVTADEVRSVGTAITAAGLQAGIYGNKTSISAVFGDSDELAYLLLWYANYPNDHHVPDISEFVPFNGWLQPHGWQYSSLGIAGINCDLSVEYLPDPPPPAPQRQLIGIGVRYDDNSTDEIWHP